MKKLLNLGMVIMVMAILISCDDEQDENPSSDFPVVVQLTDNFTLSENADWQDVFINFNKPAPTDGILKIEVTTNSLEDFQTNPDIEDDQIEVLFSKGVSKTSFKVKAVDNQTLDESRAVSFEITTVPQGYLIGEKASTTMTISDDEAPVTANFETETGNLVENNAEGLTVNISLSSPVPANGKVLIQLSENFDPEIFSTQPAFDENGIIELEAPIGANNLSFTVQAVNDALLKGHKTFSFVIAEVLSGIEKGTSLSFELSILDDELISKPKSYESFGGNWRAKRTYEYDELGRISKVHWENETPGLSSGTYTYYYSANGLIEKINSHEGIDEYFYQENGKIIKSEKVQNGVIKSYNLYDYDPAGNLGGMAIYHRQSNGDYLESFVIVNLFFDHGSIYKQLTYIPDDNSDDYILISTKTYDYLEGKSNPFPMTEAFPYDKMQNLLPNYYRVEENDEDLTYQISYEFNDLGFPINRTASGNSGNEITNYEYY